MTSIYPLTLRLQTVEAVLSLLFVNAGDLYEILQRTNLQGREEIEFRLQYLVNGGCGSSTGDCSSSSNSSNVPFEFLRDVIFCLKSAVEEIEETRAETLRDIEKGTVDVDSLSREKELEARLATGKLKTVNYR